MWSASREALALRDDPEALATSTPDQLAGLITVLVRQERFGEGTLESVFEPGLAVRFVRRPGVVAAEVEQ